MWIFCFTYRDISPVGETHPLGLGISRLARGFHSPGLTGKSNQGSEILWRVWEIPNQGGEFSPTGEIPRLV